MSNIIVARLLYPDAIDPNEDIMMYVNSRVGSIIAGHGVANGRSNQSRSEKKSRKAMLKLGMKPIFGVSHVTVKKSKNVGFFQHPKFDTSKLILSNIYGIFSADVI
ncbi:nascent polypeptide-associated complex subunit alpha-like protein 3 isoform X2 [Cucumis melo]|uniref:Nascent polypeptide-associated complex subunit alpha-like protein 3 isoform X2 n=1 Tax=Cucumis melo TaxID=3656 RepID=A0ABM3KC62_CUCME|nr:nascent polypeptide-associated complex subunit alpha-like protein 3 isoform X2 [Cucumis melo]